MLPYMDLAITLGDSNMLPYMDLAVALYPTSLVRRFPTNQAGLKSLFVDLGDKIDQKRDPKLNVSNSPPKIILEPRRAEAEGKRAGTRQLARVPTTTRARPLGA
jgi:hypothetical protein